MSTFAVYVLSSPKHILTSQKAFVSLTLFGLMNGSLTMLPGVIAYVVQVRSRSFNVPMFSDW